MMKTFLKLFIIFFILDSGYSYSQSNITSQINSNVNIYRPKYIFNGLFKTKFIIDDSSVYKIKNNQSIKLHLKPGSHTITTSRKKNIYKFCVTEGESLYFRITNNYDYFFAHFIIIGVTKEFGESELSKIKTLSSAESSDAEL